MVAERVEVSAEQRNLPPAADKNADGSRRAAGRITANMEYEKETKSNEQQATHAKEYAVNLEVELQKTCDGILALMDEGPIPSASTGEPKARCYEMKGDYYRYAKQVVFMPVPQIMEEIIEVIRLVSQERIHESIVEETIDVLVSRVMKETSKLRS